MIQPALSDPIEVYHSFRKAICTIFFVDNPSWPLDNEIAPRRFSSIETIATLKAKRTSAIVRNLFVFRWRR